MIVAKSENINELAAALARAQAAFPVIPKDSEVEVKKEGKLLYKFKYADLTTIISCIRPPLTKEGISFTNSYTKHSDLGFGWSTNILHSSGQWITTGFIPCELNPKAEMKVIAGQSTYGKRLSVSAAFGVSADEDMDAPSQNGEQINKTKQPPVGKQETKKSADDPAREKTLRDLVTKFAKLGVAVSEIENRYQLASLDMITGDQIKDLNKVGADLVNKRVTKKEAFG